MLVSLGFIVDFAKSCLPPSPVSQRVRVSDCLFFLPFAPALLDGHHVGWALCWLVFVGRASSGRKPERCRLECGVPDYTPVRHT